ncbi:FecR family protein [Pedobacter sp.]|uniref:FecR family protein n=1 Tax=Pedobacter sp. TaxID=1411316 RepID=UPI002C5ECAC7|nr:FecR domain-containing protein [Pedobacter sp.]HWW43169.1 FecR domain-containing protein [Pedobacter sp.]
MTEEETLEFFSYVHDPVYAGEVKRILGSSMEEEITGKDLGFPIQDRLLAHIFSRDLPVKRKKSISWLKYAAAVLFVTSIGSYFFFNKFHIPDTQHQYSKNNIQPGKNKAILTLADGSNIVLDDVREGEITRQAGFSITKKSNGQVVYTAVPNLYNVKRTNAINTISTPKGGQYQVVLPDGSKVWLNAASSLKFPAVFAAGQRKVELSGEAYFEVSKDKTRPFIVNTGKQQVEVLGTHFNISSYADESSTRTDLFEGAVRVTVASGSGQKQEVVLKPAQRSIVQDNKISVQPSVEKEALAWKEGYFMFNHESIESIMRKVARWYDVEILYKGDVQRETFIGRVSKYENVAELLKVLERTETIHFKIEGRKIIVSP